MRYEAREVSLNREFVVQFTNVPYMYHRDTLNTFQYVLYEGTNDIQVNYLDVTSFGVKETAAGIENADGTIGLQYPRMDRAGNYTNFYVRYSTGQAGPPIVTTGEATSVTPSSVTLNGTVNPNSVDTVGYFQYGTSANYGSTTTTTGVGSGAGYVPVSVAIADLTPDTIYHYRLVATSTSSVGTIYGNDQTFTTSSSHLLYFPHIASDGNWETEICVINTSGSQALNGTFKAYNNAGVHIISADIAATLASHGRREITVGEEFTDPDPSNIGYIVFESDSAAVVGYSKLYVEGHYRAAVSAVSEVNASSRREGVFAKLEKGGWTGITFVNTGDSTASILLTAYDDDGNAITKETVDLAGHAKMADMALNLFSKDKDISSATYITYSSDLDVVGLQFNGPSDDMMVDGLPGM